MSDDPRELARKLAEEAKKKALAKQLVERAKAGAKPKKAAPKPAPKPSLADRAPKPMSAKDALAKALEAERAAAAAKPKAKPAPKPAPMAAAPAPSVTPAAPVAKAPAPPAPVAVDPTSVLTGRLPGAQVGSLLSVGNRDAFKALWTAHRVRAAAEGDLSLLVTADVLIDAASRVPAGALSAARVTIDGTEHAVFVDASAGILLGLTGQPDLYLAGL